MKRTEGGLDRARRARAAQEQNAAVETERVAERTRELLESQRERIPGSLEELEAASNDAYADLEIEFLKYEGVDGDQEEEVSTKTFEAFVQVTDALNEVFLHLKDGEFGKRLLALSQKEVFTDDERRQAQEILNTTRPAAEHLQVLVGHAVSLLPGRERAAAVNMLSAGAIGATERIEGQRVDQSRKTIVGLVRDLAERAGEENDPWRKLVEAEPVHAKIEVRDPFSADAKSFQYWSVRSEAAARFGTGKQTLLELSREQTTALRIDVEQLADALWVSPDTDPKLRDAYEHVATWLESNEGLYDDARNLELYHLGQEDPRKLMALMRDLDHIKHANPAFFTEMMGINPYKSGEGDESMYFGSFLHKAIYNTGREIGRVETGMTHLALKDMFEDLMMMDKRVRTYSGAISREGFANMVQAAMDVVEQEMSPALRRQMAEIAGVLLLRPAIEAQVHAELSEMRELSGEDFPGEVERLAEPRASRVRLVQYVGNMPLTTLRNVDVQRSLRKVFPEDELADLGAFKERCKAVDADLVVAAYDNVPVFASDRNESLAGLVLREAYAYLAARLSVDEEEQEYRKGRQLTNIQEDRYDVPVKMEFLSKLSERRTFYAGMLSEGDQKRISYDEDLYAFYRRSEGYQKHFKVESWYPKEWNATERGGVKPQDAQRFWEERIREASEVDRDVLIGLSMATLQHEYVGSEPPGEGRRTGAYYKYTDGMKRLLDRSSLAEVCGVAYQQVLKTPRGQENINYGSYMLSMIRRGFADAGEKWLPRETPEQVATADAYDKERDERLIEATITTGKILIEHKGFSASEKLETLKTMMANCSPEAKERAWGEFLQDSDIAGTVFSRLINWEGETKGAYSNIPNELLNVMGEIDGLSKVALRAIGIEKAQPSALARMAGETEGSREIAGDTYTVGQKLIGALGTFSFLALSGSWITGLPDTEAKQKSWDRFTSLASNAEAAQVLISEISVLYDVYSPEQMTELITEDAKKHRLLAAATIEKLPELPLKREQKIEMLEKILDAYVQKYDFRNILPDRLATGDPSKLALVANPKPKEIMTVLHLEQLLKQHNRQLRNDPESQSVVVKEFADIAEVLRGPPVSADKEV